MCFRSNKSPMKRATNVPFAFRNLKTPKTLGKLWISKFSKVPSTSDTLAAIRIKWVFHVSTDVCLVCTCSTLLAWTSGCLPINVVPFVEWISKLFWTRIIVVAVVAAVLWTTKHQPHFQKFRSCLSNCNNLHFLAPPFFFRLWEAFDYWVL